MSEPAPQTVTIPVATLQGMQARLAQLEGAQALEASARQAAEAKALVDQGRADAVVKQFQDQLAAVTDKAKVTAIDAQLRAAIGAHAPELVSGASVEQLRELFAPEFVADATPDGFAVRTKAFQSPSDFVAQRLASKEYGHFRKPGAAGSTPTATGAFAAPGSPLPHEIPVAQAPDESMGQFFMRRAAAIRHRPGGGDPTTNLSLPMGLKARR